MQVAADRTDASTAIQADLPAIFVSLELSRSTWLITSLSPGAGEEDVEAFDSGRRCGGLARAVGPSSGRKREERTGRDFPIIAIQEAGLDDFWIHRVLQSEGIESHVVDAASILTSRRRRRAKTDGIDGETLVRTLTAYKRGEPWCARWSRRRHPKRKIAAGSAGSARRSRWRAEWNTSTGSEGCSSPKASPDYEPLKRNRRAQLEELKTGDGRPLPAHPESADQPRTRPPRTMVLPQLKAVEAERNALVKPVSEGCPTPAAMLAQLKGMGPEFTAILWSEGLFRSFSNRRQLAAYAGLKPTPWQSGSVAHEQGVSKAGNPRLRTTMIQLAWLWLRHQPTSALSIWFQSASRATAVRCARPRSLRWLASSSSRCGNIQPAVSSSRAPAMKTI